MISIDTSVLFAQLIAVMSESIVTSILRPEARPFEWAALNESQQLAFQKILRAMGEAVDAIHLSERDKDHQHELDPNRTNQTIMLSGGRGMGKTSMMLSVKNTLHQAKIGKNPFDGELGKLVDKVKDHAVWLETLDLEPLPGSTNLLVSILARIEHAIKGQSNDQIVQGLLSPHTGREEALMKLSQLKTDASLSWDGNISQRGEHLDPDSYAHEVYRTETSRLSLNSKFREALDALAEKGLCSNGKKSALFILPVDDFDLKPTLCIDLLRLLRVISVPRLFTLVLGDVELAQNVFRMKLIGEYSRLADAKLQVGGFDKEGIKDQVLETAAHGMRKLLPPGQRVFLYPTPIDKAFEYKPSNKDQSIEDLLERYSLGKLYKGAGSILKKGAKFKDFLMVSSLLGSSNQRVYSGLTFIVSTPREIADLWFLINEMTGEQTAEIYGLLHVFQELLKNSALSDSNINDDQRKLLNSILSAPLGGAFVFNTNFLRVDWVISEPRSINVDFDSGNNKKRSLGFQQNAFCNIRYHGLERINTYLPDLFAGRKDKELLPLENRTAGCVALCHDLAVLDNDSQIFGTNFVDQTRDLGLVQLTWKLDGQSFLVKWPGFEFKTFWDLDLFTDAWNKMLSFWNSSKHSNEVHYYATSWATIGMSLILGKKANVSETFGFGDEFRKILEELLSQSEKNEYAERALIDFAVLLSPECGVEPKRIEFLFQAKDATIQKLQHFWSSNYDRITIKRSQTVGYYVEDDERGQDLSKELGRIEDFENALDGIKLPNNEDMFGRLMLVNPNQYIAQEVAFLRYFSERQSNNEFSMYYHEIADLLSHIGTGNDKSHFHLIEMIQHVRSAIRKERKLSGSLRAQRRVIERIERHAEFVSMMALHPVNQFQDGILCPR